MPYTRHCLTPYGLPLVEGEAAESRYRNTAVRLPSDCTTRTGFDAGAEIGPGVEVRGFNPSAILFALVTPGFKEIACAYGRTIASVVTRAVFFALTVCAVLVDPEVTSAYALVKSELADAIVTASLAKSPYVPGDAEIKPEKLVSQFANFAS
jgi:hypothetical protein